MTTHDTGQDPRLHPQAAAVLAARGARSLTTMSVDEARATHAAGSAARPPGPAPAELVDLAIAGVPVRRYRPAAPSGAAVVYFHGGGWVLGSLETHDQQCRLLCQGTSATVISVDYRLAPEHPFPAAVDDAVAVTAAVLAGDVGGGIGEGGNGGDGGIDPTRVAVAGDSAGGNLAAAVTIALRDAGGPRPAAQLLVYPALDAAMTAPSYHEPHDGLFLTGDEMAWFYDRYAPGCPPGDCGSRRCGPTTSPAAAGAGRHRRARPAARRGRGLRPAPGRGRGRGHGGPVRGRVARLLRLEPRRRPKPGPHRAGQPLAPHPAGRAGAVVDRMSGRAAVSGRRHHPARQTRAGRAARWPPRPGGRGRPSPGSPPG